MLNIWFMRINNHSESWFSKTVPNNTLQLEPTCCINYRPGSDAQWRPNSGPTVAGNRLSVSSHLQRTQGGWVMRLHMNYQVDTSCYTSINVMSQQTLQELCAANMTWILPHQQKQQTSGERLRPHSTSGCDELEPHRQLPSSNFYITEHCIFKPHLFRPTLTQNQGGRASFDSWKVVIKIKTNKSHQSFWEQVI